MVYVYIVNLNQNHIYFNLRLRLRPCFSISHEIRFLIEINFLTKTDDRTAYGRS